MRESSREDGERKRRKKNEAARYEEKGKAVDQFFDSLRAVFSLHHDVSALFAR